MCGTMTMNAARRMMTGATLIALAALASACADVSKPQPQMAAAPVVTVTGDTGTLVRETAPRNTGTYPSLSAPLTAANTQMSDQEAADMQARLSGLAHARKSGSISEAEYRRRVAEMRKLAADHGAETQAEIAN